MSLLTQHLRGPYLRPHPAAAITQSSLGGGWTRRGTIILRAYPGDLFTDQDLREIKKGGRRHVGEVHRPGYVWDEAERILDNLCCDKVEFHNVACNAGRTQILNYIGNNIASGNIASFPGCNVFAVGNGNFGSTPPASTDTQLLAEQFRKQVSSGGTYGNGVSGNSVDTTCTFATTEANFTYTEAGIFAVTGTLPGSTNAGTIFGHASYAYTKTSSISLTNDYIFFEN